MFWGENCNWKGWLRRRSYTWNTARSQCKLSWGLFGGQRGLMYSLYSCYDSTMFCLLMVGSEWPNSWKAHLNLTVKCTFSYLLENNNNNEIRCCEVEILELKRPTKGRRVIHTQTLSTGIAQTRPFEGGSIQFWGFYHELPSPKQWSWKLAAPKESMHEVQCNAFFQLMFTWCLSGLPSLFLCTVSNQKLWWRTTVLYI